VEEIKNKEEREYEVERGANRREKSKEEKWTE
jgi:hypothetical protein